MDYSHEASTLGLLALLWIAGLHGAGNKRFRDESFLKSTLIYGRNVTCKEQKAGFFPAQTWTCANLRVSGTKVAYGYYPSFSSTSKCTDVKSQNDFGGLCLLLLKGISENRTLWAASITNATCEHTPEMRVLFKKAENNTYEWTDFKPGHGWIETLHCITLLEDGGK